MTRAEMIREYLDNATLELAKAQERFNALETNRETNKHLTNTAKTFVDFWKESVRYWGGAK